MITREALAPQHPPQAQRTIFLRWGAMLLLGALLLTATVQGTAQSKDNPWHIAVSVPFPCVCYHFDAGYAPTPSTLYGVSAYHGAGFMFLTSEKRQQGVFFRFYPLAGSLYLQANAGYMTTTHETLDSGKSDHEGAYLGAVIGNLWKAGDHFSHGIAWYGEDRYINPIGVSHLTHLLRYQVGLRF